MIESARYIVITPVRNEAEYLQSTIRSMRAQKVQPISWVIVNDGSTDQTGQIIDEAAKSLSWIRPVHRSDRGFRQAGEGVIGAFYDGFDLVKDTAWDFVVKLDGDLSFEPDYFERCLRAFAQQPQLGIGGGTICNLVNGVLTVESKIDPAFHVRGATKIYRHECWQAIGGLIRAAGWDTVDELKANMLGWITRTFSEVKVVHHRPAGQAYGMWQDWLKNGRANYVAGYHPLFMLAKFARRLFEKPYVTGACGLLIGFTGAALRRVPKVGDENLIKYFQRQQFNRLLGRKSLWS